MAAQRYKNILFSYIGLISSPDEINAISDYFESIQKSIEQANYSEMIDLKNYTKSRNANKIKKMLCGNHDKPFVFLMTLN